MNSALGREKSLTPEKSPALSQDGQIALNPTPLSILAPAIETPHFRMFLRFVEKEIRPFGIFKHASHLRFHAPVVSAESQQKRISDGFRHIEGTGEDGTGSGIHNTPCVRSGKKRTCKLAFLFHAARRSPKINPVPRLGDTGSFSLGGVGEVGPWRVRSRGGNRIYLGRRIRLTAARPPKGTRFPGRSRGTSAPSFRRIRLLSGFSWSRLVSCLASCPSRISVRFCPRQSSTREPSKKTDT